MTPPRIRIAVERPAFLGVVAVGDGGERCGRDRLVAGGWRALAIAQRYQLPEMLAAGAWRAAMSRSTLGGFSRSDHPQADADPTP